MRKRRLIVAAQTVSVVVSDPSPMMTDAQYLEWVAEHMVSFRPNTPNIATMIYIEKSGLERKHTYHDKTSFTPTILSMLKGTIDEIIRQAGVSVETARGHG